MRLPFKQFIGKDALTMQTLRSILLTCLLPILAADLCFAQWVQTNGPSANYINCLTVSGSNLFAGTDSGVFHSPESSTASWALVNNGLSYLNISAIAVKIPDIYLGLNGGSGVFRSTNEGAQWTDRGLSTRDVRCFVVRGADIFAGADDGVFLSTNDRETWKSIGSGIYAVVYVNVHALASIGSDIVAGTTDGVFFSTNDGAT